MAPVARARGRLGRGGPAAVLVAAVVLLAAAGGPGARASRPLRGGAGDRAGRQDAGGDNAGGDPRPLVGVVAQSGSPAPEGHTYIAASYIKFVEASGARAVPILEGSTRAEVEALFPRLNAVVFPGGNVRLTEPNNPFMETLTHLYLLAEGANERGQYFPIWAVCLGFEALTILASGRDSVYGPFNAEDYAAALAWTDDVWQGRLFADFGNELIGKLANQPLAFENHKHGLAVPDFAQYLAADYLLLSTSKDRDDRAYVSTIEHKTKPYYGFQWHPEKNLFEWNPTEVTLAHTADAISVTNKLCLFFGKELRKRHVVRPPEAEREIEKLLIYNYPLKYTGRLKPSGGVESGFDEAYIFSE